MFGDTAGAQALGQEVVAELQAGDAPELALLVGGTLGVSRHSATVEVPLLSAEVLSLAGGAWQVHAEAVSLTGAGSIQVSLCAQTCELQVDARLGSILTTGDPVTGIIRVRTDATRDGLTPMVLTMDLVLTQDAVELRYRVVVTA